MIMREIIESGLARGHEISRTSVRPSARAYDTTADLDIICDIHNYGHSLQSLGAWRRFDEALLESITKRRPFIHVNNAYVDICNIAYLPCSGNASSVCPHKDGGVIDNIIRRERGSKCFAARQSTRRLFADAKLNVFLSPLHKDVVYGVLDITDQEVPTFIIKPIIDHRRFYNKNGVRDIEHLFVGVIGEAKGLAEMRKRFAGTDIHFAGRIAKGEVLDFGTYHGPVPYEKVPDLMNRAKNFVFLPRWPEPQGRVAIEAALCGCNLITNANVGATSFAMDLSDFRQFENATDEFWLAVEAVTGVADL